MRASDPARAPDSSTAVAEDEANANEEGGRAGAGAERCGVLGEDVEFFIRAGMSAKGSVGGLGGDGGVSIRDNFASSA